MHLLVIENGPSIRKALRIGMTQRGWLINTVPTSAANVIHMCQYDIVIANFDEEEMAVLDMIRKIKQQNQELIVIGLTRKSLGEFFSMNDAAFVNACCQKPLRLNMLKKIINLEVKKLGLKKTEKEKINITARPPACF